MLNWLKVGAVRMADILNGYHDPLDEFSRPVVVKFPETLAEKAKQFEDDLAINFTLANGIITYNRSFPLDIGDQALWHGIYTAMFAFKYAVTKDQRDGKSLYNALIAQQNHIHNGKLIRGVEPVTGLVADDASNDTLTGFLTGAYFGWKYGESPMMREIPRQLIQAIADELLQNDFAIVTQAGVPTTYGKLIDGWKTDPLRLTLALAIFRFAFSATGTAKYFEVYSDLLRRYAELIPYAKAKLWWIDKNYDTHRAALHLTILADLANGGWEKPLCLKGLERIYQLVRKSGNAWVLFLCARHIPISEFDIANAKKLLSEFAFEDKGPRLEKINSTREDIVKTVWNDEWISRQPLPIWQRAAQDFTWQRSLYTLDGWKGSSDPRRVNNGGDFLVAYWLGVLLGKIGNTE